MRRSVHSLLTLVGIAAGVAVTLYLILGLILSAVLASTIAMGLGAGSAVYVERRWVRSDGAAAAEALLYGTATAGGWAAALLISHLL